MKKNIEKMKEDIKSLVTNQIVTKANRKTVKFIGKRKMEPWEANYRVHDNKDLLRQYYQTYAIIRYRDSKCHEIKDDELQKLFYDQRVLELLKKYKHEEVVCSDTE